MNKPITISMTKCDRPARSRRVSGPGRLRSTPPLVSAIRSRIAESFAQLGARAGSEFKQEPGTDCLANLVDYDELFRSVIAERKLLACVQRNWDRSLNLAV